MKLNLWQKTAVDKSAWKPELETVKYSVTPNIIHKVLTGTDLSKVTGPDCIPVMVLRNGQWNSYW